MLLTAIISTIMFAFMIGLGRLLLFVDGMSLWLIPIFFLFLLLIQRLYQEGTCKTMEAKDFVGAMIVVLIFLVIRMLMGNETSLDELSYYYLISFLCISSYASSIRFKSLL